MRCEWLGGCRKTIDWYKRIGFHLDTRFMIVREKRDGRWEMGDGRRWWKLIAKWVIVPTGTVSWPS